MNVIAYALMKGYCMNIREDGKIVREI